jgi:hypothetical protein
MKSFKKFLEEANFNKGTIIDVDPVHGGHSKPPKHNKKGTIIDVDPVHGGHSKPPKKKIDESQHENFYPIDSEGNEHINDVKSRNWNEHLGDNVKEVHAKINKSYDDFNKNPHHSALRNYSGGSWETNHELINKATGGRSLFQPSRYDTEADKESKKRRSEMHDDHVNNLDASFHHPDAVLKHDLHVFHGTNKFNPGEKAREGGGRITIPSYLSTSIDPKVALDFSGSGGDAHILHIHLKKGQKANYIGSHSSYDYEREALLPRNSTIKVNPIPTVTHNGYRAKIHIWHGHIEEEHPTSRKDDAERKDDTDKNQLKFNF